MHPVVAFTDHWPRVQPLMDALASLPDVLHATVDWHCLPRHRQLSQAWPLPDGAAPEVLLLCSTPAHARTLLRQALQRLPDTLVWVHDTDASHDEQMALLALGADRVSAGPLSPAELRARLSSLRRRHAHLQHRRQQIGRFEYDEEGKVILLDGRKLPLSAREWLVLGQLLKRHPDLCSREELLHQLARHHYGSSHQILDVNFHKLREKIHPLGVQIQTLRGLGYRLQMQKPAVSPAKPETLPSSPELMRLFFGQAGHAATAA